MRALVREAMLQGAMGVSTALEYTPAPYASTEELIALATEAANFGGIYASHMRDEGDNEPAALDEAIRIGREAHIPVEIFHLKVAGKSDFGKMPALVAKIEAARASGVDITADTYAYPAWFNGVSAFIPPWAHDGGDSRLIERLRDPAIRARIRKDMETPGGHWDNEWLEITGPKDILIGAVQNPDLLALQGKTLADLAVLWKEDPLNALFDLIIKDDAFTGVAVFAVSEPDITLALQQPWVSICNDSAGASPDGLLGKEHPHPRAYATFPRILRKYVREEAKLSLPGKVLRGPGFQTQQPVRH
jgi:N-acyl-D-amino-acid deacylase